MAMFTGLLDVPEAGDIVIGIMEKKMATTIISTYRLYRDNGKEHRNYYRCTQRVQKLACRPPNQM